MRAVILLLMLTFGSPAGANGFMNNRKDWNDAAFSADIQKAYAMGIFDQLIQTDKISNKWQRMFLYCAQEMNLTPTDFVDIIEGHYRNLENWQDAPSVALERGFATICKNIF
jgi:hypothetical protein